MTGTDLIEKTLYAERRRAFASGVIDSGSTSLFLLIALRWFDAGPFTKALIASAPQIGLLFGPLVIHLARRHQIPSATMASTLMVFAMVSFLLAAALPYEASYLICVVIGVGMSGASVPLFTSIYHANYPAGSLGTYYSRIATLKTLVSIAAAFTFGYALNGRLELYPLLLWIYSFLLFVAARSVRECPSPTLEPQQQLHVLSGFGFLRSDHVFRNTIISWMIMGFGTLMLAPLRVEYLAHPRYGLAISEAHIALFVSTIPSIAKLLAGRTWGLLFDKLSFFTLRVVVNTGFLLGAIAFFCSDSMVGLALSAILYGVSMAGGDVAWQLWTTKFAPPNRVADYMAVHTACTGIRGLLAPLVGFSIVAHLPITTIAAIGASMILLANVGLVREALRERTIRSRKEQGEIRDS